jgi:type IV pilus assembly protein PilB
MGIEPFLIASTVRTVIGQRLVRRLSDDGLEQYDSDQAETAAINDNIGKLLPEDEASMAKTAEDIGYKTLPLAGQKSYKLYRGVDKPEHPGGYKGRLGLYEVFDMSDEIQKLILDRATSTDIQKAAAAKGMISMRQDGYLKALAGMTTVEEVNRVAAAENS